MADEASENLVSPISIRNSDLTILVTDDSRTLRMMVESKLKEQGYGRVIVAENGQQALAMLRTERVDCLLCDWDMPVLNGYQVLVEMKHDPELKNIPFILVTAKATKNDILNAIKAGVDEYVVKPIQFPVLLRKILEVLVRRQQNRK
ncbi:MAG: response regulator [Fibrobacteres bacterium]|nr:response regulator [Fibrobacterota bacterium]